MNKIEEVLTRGVEKIYPSKDDLSKLMRSRKIRLYLGIDPSKPILHIGHGLVLKKLREFQDLGHEVIYLIGDFTAMMGDPSDKSESRPKLTRAQVLENAKLYKKQAEFFLRFSGKNPAKLMFNSKWLGKLSFEDGLNLMANFTIQQLLERDMFQKRFKENKPLYSHEIVYPILQAYDSVAMDVDLEIGGTDQTFNMLVGRTLMQTLKNKEKLVLTLKLLSGTDGQKMSKSLSNYVPILSTSSDVFASLMALHDNQIAEYLELATDFTESDIEKFLQEIKSGENPMNIKKKIAFDITRQYYGVDKAKKAQDEFEETFQKGGFSEIALEIKNKGTLLETILEIPGIESKTNAKRLIFDSAVDVDGKVVNNAEFKLNGGEKIKIGKRIFVRIK